MKIIITAVQDLFVRGGAELYVENLQAALVRSGHEVEVVRLPFRWYPKEEVLRQAYQWRMMDLRGTGTDLVITTKFPTFYVRADRKIAWVLHQHRPVYDCFGNPEMSPYLPHDATDVAIREAIQSWDNASFREMSHLFTISRTVSKRMERFNHRVAPPLFHPPPSAEKLHPGPYGDYVFLPSRLEDNKRPWLLAEAMAKTKTPIRAVLAGKGGAERRVREAAQALGVADRIELVGYVSDEERIRLYANARAVFYPPYGEDLGYVTLEAFLAQKPVVTFQDSGDPAELVSSGVNGFVVNDSTEAAAALDRYFDDKKLAEQHGKAGRATYQDTVLSWESICERLTVP